MCGSLWQSKIVLVKLFGCHSSVYTLFFNNCIPRVYGTEIEINVAKSI